MMKPEGAAVTLQDLRTLLDFHYWARDRMLDALEPLTHEQFTRDMGSSFRSLRDTAAHIYSAEWAWHSRWRGTPPPAPLSPDLFPDVATLRAAWSELEAQMRAFLDGLDVAGVDRVIAYTLFSGAAGTTPSGRCATLSTTPATIGVRSRRCCGGSGRRRRRASI